MEVVPEVAVAQEEEAHANSSADLLYHVLLMNVSCDYVDQYFKLLNIYTSL